MTTLAEIRAALELALARDAIVAHRLTRDLLVSLPADGVIVTSDSLARALAIEAMGVARGLQRDGTPYPADVEWATAILAVLAAEGGPA